MPPPPSSQPSTQSSQSPSSILPAVSTSGDADRLGLAATQRVLLAGMIAGTFGLIHGTAKGAKLAALRYLAENAHRLPRTKGTWYFFHKRRNIMVLKGGLDRGFITGVKYAGVAALFVGTEALVDEFGTHRASFLGTTAGAATVGIAVNAANKLPWRLALRSTRNFALCGAAIGLVLDGLHYVTPFLDSDVDDIINDGENMADRFVKDIEVVDQSTQNS